MGLSYEFTNAVDYEMVITGSNNIVALNDLSASTLTFTTASEHIGARVRVRAEYVDTTLKWIVDILCSNTLTVA